MCISTRLTPLLARMSASLSPLQSTQLEERSVRLLRGKGTNGLYIAHCRIKMAEVMQRRRLKVCIPHPLQTLCKSARVYVYLLLNQVSRIKFTGNFISRMGSVYRDLQEKNCGIYCLVYY